MAEVIVMIVLFLILIVIQLYDKNKIIFSVRKNKLKLVLAIMLAMGILSYFWPSSQAEQFKLVILVILILNFTFTKEGLGEEKIIKAGFIDTHYDNFEKVVIEPSNSTFTYVTFYKKSIDHNGITLEVNNSTSELHTFFTKFASTLEVEFTKT